MATATDGRMPRSHERSPGQLRDQRKQAVALGYRILASQPNTTGNTGSGSAPNGATPYMADTSRSVRFPVS